MPTLLIATFIVYKVVDLFLFFIAPRVVPYLGFFSYGDQVLKYNMPDFLRATTNFDGIFYIRIATQGYSHTEQAYFPLYSILINLITYITLNPIISGLIISNICFTIGLYFFYSYISAITTKRTAIWTSIFLLIYPTSYYFGVMYTESLFFMLFTATLYTFYKKQWFLAFIFAYLTATTKVIGVLVCVPLLFSLFGEYMQHKNAILTFLRNHIQSLLVCAAPALGILSYCTYLYITLGDPLYFLHAQESFGANRSSSFITPLQVLYRYIKIFSTADLSIQYYVAINEVVFYLSAMGVLLYQLILQYKAKIKSYHRLGLVTFSLLAILIPSLTGTLTAMPRYTLMCLSLYIIFAEITHKWLRIVLIAIFLCLHIVMAILFAQGYYIT
jgi:hypothetical protein